MQLLFQSGTLTVPKVPKVKTDFRWPTTISAREKDLAHFAKKLLSLLDPRHNGDTDIFWGGDPEKEKTNQVHVRSCARCLVCTSFCAYEAHISQWQVASFNLTQRLHRHGYNCSMLGRVGTLTAPRTRRPQPTSTHASLQIRHILFAALQAETEQKREVEPANEQSIGHVWQT